MLSRVWQPSVAAASRCVHSSAPVRLAVSSLSSSVRRMSSEPTKTMAKAEEDKQYSGVTSAASPAQSSTPPASASSNMTPASKSNAGTGSLAGTATAYPGQVAPPVASSASPSDIALSPTSQPFGLASGAPEEFVHRKVRILRPANTASQQGFTGIWKIEFECTSKWLNPLMGWTSTKDMAHQLTNALQFATKEEAISFAQREGFEYDVEPAHVAKPIKKSYADNYKWYSHTAAHTRSIGTAALTATHAATVDARAPGTRRGTWDRGPSISRSVTHSPLPVCVLAAVWQEGAASGQEAEGQVHSERADQRTKAAGEQSMSKCSFGVQLA